MRALSSRARSGRVERPVETRLVGPAILPSALLLALLAGPAAAQPASREAELEAIRGEIAGLQAELSQVSARRAGLRGELDRLELELALQGKRIEEAGAERDLAAGRLAETEREVAGLERRVRQARHVVRGSLAGLYRLGRQGYLRLLLSIRSRESLLPGIRQLRFLARRDARALEGYLDSRARLASERQELEARRRELDTWLAREGERRRELVRLEVRQRGLLARVEGERRTLASRAGQLAEKERKLANFVDFLTGRATTGLAGPPMQNFRGVLDWPVAGRVVERFGPRLDPRYKTRVPHQGIDIATRRESEVRAVFPGKVLFAAPFQGYGLTAVVQHPGRVFTLYAGLSELRVGKDQRVGHGDLLGRAGERLYFEIRVEDKPEDPAHWLR
jgi:septal ring factor EnvC (AmiA/AmiB activator)